MTLQDFMDMTTRYHIDCEQIKNQYKLDDDSKIIGNTLHRRLVGHAMAVANAVVNNGGSDDEIKIVLSYLIVCIDAMKHKLDYKRFATDHNVKELAKKYRIQK